MKTTFTKHTILVLAALLLIHVSGYSTKFTVTVQNFSFNPSDLPNVHIGDTIHWEWVSGSHTTTSTTIPSGAATWDHPLNSSSTSFEYKVTVAGTYNYKCTPHESMGMVGSFTASITSGITESAGTPVITIYPDPVKSTATVNYRSAANPLAMIRIFDLTGKLVMERRIEDRSGNSDIVLDMTALLPGLYFASFVDDRNNAVVRRVVKN